MKILATNVYVGPSQYAHFRVIRHLIDLDILEEWPTSRLGDDFTNGLLAALPGLKEHGCSYGEPGGFIRRMTEDEGTWLGHVLEHVALELQNVAGSDVSFGRTRSTDERGVYNMVFEYQQRDVGLRAARLGRKLILSLLPADLQEEIDDAPGSDFSFEEERDTFIRVAQRLEFGPSTASLIKAAEERGIPWIRLNKYSLVQLGHGKFQKRIQATITSQTNNIAVEIACDKEDTHTLLEDLGLPVPQQRLVYSETEAVRAARAIGHPVVLKPLNGNHGRGVSINLTTDEQVETAFTVAREKGTSQAILVERFIAGIDHRMLVVDGKLVAVAKRVPGHVVGDGKHTIEELVEIVNSDPRRGIGHEKVLTRLEFDVQANRLLEQAGKTRETVLDDGELLYLRSTGNLSTGGTAVDVTDIVHPDNRDMAERAIKAVGLDVGGVDFLTPDITQSWQDIGGAICEVNAAPGFRMHLAPSEGTPRDVAGPVMDMLFPAGAPSRIPIAAITGTNGKTTTTRMLAHILKIAGHTPGMTSSDGIYIDGRLTVRGDMTGPASAKMVLRDADVDIAVMETARGGLLRSGLGFLKTDVSACLNIASDHLGMRGIDTLEQLAEIKRTVIEVATGTAVLNADDRLCLEMADYTEAEHVCYVTMNPDHALVRAHVQNGGRAVVLEKGINGDMITIYNAGQHIPLLWTHLIPATLEGKARHNVQNAMFAAAMAYSLDKSLDDIRHGLRTFDTTFFQAPGRLNVYDEHPFKVILDYAHNPSAIVQLCDVVRQLDVEGRRLCVLSAPGDRRDEDIREIGEAAAGVFDYYICRADDNRRGRGDDEVPRMLRDALIESGVSDESVVVVPDESEAVRQVLAIAGLGDLVMIFADAISRTWDQITGFDASEQRDGVQTPVIARQPSGGTSDPETKEASDVTDYVETEFARLIRDDRGVRLAREIND